MRSLCVFLALSFCQSAFAEPLEITSKIICSNGEGYFTLSDGSFWKAIPFEKRWRSVSEWWNNTQLIPENYETKPCDFLPGACVEVVEKAEVSDVDESNAGNKEMIRRCTHLFRNEHNQQVLFAIALSTQTAGAEIYNQAFQDGYVKAEVDASISAYKEKDAAYRRGHSDGYFKGYQDAVKRFSQENNRNNRD